MEVPATEAPPADQLLTKALPGTPVSSQPPPTEQRRRRRRGDVRRGQNTLRREFSRRSGYWKSASFRDAATKVRRCSGDVSLKKRDGVFGRKCRSLSAGVKRSEGGDGNRSRRRRLCVHRLSEKDLDPEAQINKSCQIKRPHISQVVWVRNTEYGGIFFNVLKSWLLVWQLLNLRRRSEKRKNTEREN